MCQKWEEVTEQEVIDQALRILEARMHRPDFYATSPSIVKDYLKLKLGELEHETFNVMFLNSKHGLISLTELFRGTINSTSVPVREVVKEALYANAAALIISHNHPSHSCEPSRADKALTDALVKALNLVEVRVLDHVIVGGDQAYSMAEHGQIEPDYS